MSDTNPSRGIRLGAVGGAPILLMPSWFLVAIVIGLLYVPQLSSLGAAAYVIAGGVALILLASVFVHELAHAFAARSVGTRPQRIVLDLWGGHTAFEGEMLTPFRSAYVSLAGPAVNLVIGALTWWLLPQDLGVVGALLGQSLYYINLGLALFNALPGLPLDGGRALEAVVWAATGNRGTGSLVAGWVGRGIAVALVLYATAVPLLRGQQLSIGWVIWSLLIASMLWRGASAATEVGHWRRRAPRLRTETFTRPAVAVPSGATLAPLLADSAVSNGLATGAELIVVDAQGAPIGVVDRSALGAVPSHALSSTPVDSVARRMDPTALLPLDLTGERLLQQLQDHPAKEYAVRDAHGRVIGLLIPNDVAAALRGRT